MNRIKLYKKKQKRVWGWFERKTFVRTGYWESKWVNKERTRDKKEEICELHLNIEQ